MKPAVCLILVGVLIGQTLPAPTLLSTQFQGASSGGDTQTTAWSSGPTLAGVFQGGAIIGAYNDGTTGPCGSANLCLYQLQTYDSVTSANTTFASVNTMSSYGAAAAHTCADGSTKSMKSRAMVFLPGAFLMVIGCMETAAGPTQFNWYQTGVIVSCDGGKTFSNYKTYQANSNTCAGGVSNGDNPVDSAGFQFDPTGAGSKLARLQIIDFLCQDNTINCPVAGGVDSAHLYFVGTDSALNNGKIYIYRTPKTVPGVMLPGNWQAYNNGVWDSTLANATDQGNGAFSNGTCCGKAAYLKDYRTFLHLQHNGGSNNIPTQTAPTPWGPWVTGPTITIADVNTGFPSLIGGLCPKYATAGHVTCTAFMNGATNGGTLLYIRELDMGTPPTVGTTASGVNFTGNTQVR